MTFSELIQLLRQSLGALIAIPAACALAVAIICWGFMPDQYSTTVSFYVLAKSTTQGESSGTLTNSELTTSQQLANDIAVLLESQSIEDSAVQAAGLANLGSYRITVENNTHNRMINLKVTGPDPATAARVADAVAVSTSQLAQQIMNLDSVKIVDRAKVPTEPSGPNRAAYTGAAFLTGLFIALIIVILLDITSTSVRSAKELEQRFGLPSMGHIPYVKGAKTHDRSSC